MSRFFRRRFGLLLFLLVLLGAAAVAADWWFCVPEGTKARFVGGKTCMDCHQQEYKKWHGSHHDLAMDLPNEQSVRGDFENTEFEYNGVISKFFRQDGKYRVETDGPDGKPQAYDVKYTFGIEPLQQYLVETEGGRLQTLPFCWDTENKKWFHIYANDPKPIDYKDPLHWTKSGQNWNHMCADCHSTDVYKNYDADSDTFRTAHAEIDVSCEACHGPGSTHVKLAKSKWFFWDRRLGYGLVKLKDNTKQQLQICAQCHSHRSKIYPGYKPGDELMDHYLPSLLDNGMYHVDGQIDGEVYVHGSFQQSLMYRKGVRCTDCHDPHSTRTHFTGNQLCAKCHVPAKYDSRDHHHHDPAGNGGQCVECHMPAKKYMVVDPRRDHSLRVPRPDLSLQLGAPNACSGCHLERENKSEKWKDYAEWLDAARNVDESVREEARKVLREKDQWAYDWVKKWFGDNEKWKERTGKPHFALALAAGMRGELEAPLGDDEKRPDLRHPLAVQREILGRLVRLASDKENAGPNVRASAVSLLRQFAGAETRDMHPAAREIIQQSRGAVDKALQDDDPQVRRAAVSAMANFYTAPPSMMWRFDKLDRRIQSDTIARVFQPLAEKVAPLLDDPLRAVRMEAARVLSFVPKWTIPRNVRRPIDRSLLELEQGFLASADQAQSQMMLAHLYGNLGEFDRAEAAYRTALKRQPSFLPARRELAELYDFQDKNAEAEVLLRDAIKIARENLTGNDAHRLLPVLAQYHYSLGLLLAKELRRLREAAAELAEAVRLNPDAPRYRYNWGLALRDLDQWDRAEQQLTTVLSMNPTSRDFQIALADLMQKRIDRARRANNWPEALRHAKRAVELLPSPQFRDQLKAIEQRLKKKSE